MDLGLAGKTAIVTGGGSNIGKAIALTFAREGANLVVAEIDKVQGDRVAEEAKALRVGGKAICVKTDVTDAAQVQNTVAEAIRQFGQVHALVNNVGWDDMKFFLEYTPEVIDRIIKINFWGMVNCCRAVLPHMIEKRYGRVVTIGSDAGRMGEFKEPIYSGMKAGLIGLTKSVAREMGRYNITLNVVCPGVTVPQRPEDAGEQSMWRAGGTAATMFTPEARERAKAWYALRRLGTPQETANAVVFLASEAASFITGQTLSVSGGYTMM